MPRRSAKFAGALANQLFARSNRPWLSWKDRHWRPTRVRLGSAAWSWSSRAAGVPLCPNRSSIPPQSWKLPLRLDIASSRPTWRLRTERPVVPANSVQSGKKLARISQARQQSLHSATPACYGRSVAPGLGVRQCLGQTLWMAATCALFSHPSRRTTEEYFLYLYQYCSLFFLVCLAFHFLY